MSIVQRVAPPTSMYSMKRTSAPRSLAKSIKSLSSSSLYSRITTVLILRGFNPPSAAASIPSSTSWRRSRRVSCSNRCGRSVSRLTLTRSSPALRSDSACFASNTPLVVMLRSPTSGFAATRSTTSTTSRRSSGSPPVSRTLSTPSSLKTSTSSPISSTVRISSRGNQTYSSSGIQYWQRRLHLSISEMRRLLRGRPNVSSTVRLLLELNCLAATVAVKCRRAWWTANLRDWDSRSARGALAAPGLECPRLLAWHVVNSSRSSTCSGPRNTTAGFSSACLRSIRFRCSPPRNAPTVRKFDFLTLPISKTQHELGSPRAFGRAPGARRPEPFHQSSMNFDHTEQELGACSSWRAYTSSSLLALPHCAAASW